MGGGPSRTDGCTRAMTSVGEAVRDLHEVARQTLDMSGAWRTITIKAERYAAEPVMIRAGESEDPMALIVLDTNVMLAREAARQLRIPPTTLTHWLEGGERRGNYYQPVLREDPTGSTIITWGEMVEARYLRAYRHGMRISMQTLRPFVSALRQEFGVPYPLAHFKPWVDENRRLILELQSATDLPTDLRLIFEVQNGQTILNPLLREDFLARVDFAEGGEQEATRIWPHGKRAPVVLDPRISSAASTVHGVRTEVIAEQINAGATVEDVADEFDLPIPSVRAALSWEWEGNSAA